MRLADGEMANATCALCRFDLGFSVGGLDAGASGLLVVACCAGVLCAAYTLALCCCCRSAPVYAPVPPEQPKAG
jgi:hypothetical protein